MRLPSLVGLGPVTCMVMLTGSLAAAQQAPGPAASSPDDQYMLGPDSHPQAGLPEGKVLEFILADSKTYPGFAHRWWLYVPAQYDGSKPVALMVFQDGQSYVERDGPWRVPVVLDNLIAKHELPVMAAVFINPGIRHPDPHLRDISTGGNSARSAEARHDHR